MSKLATEILLLATGLIRRRWEETGRLMVWAEEVRDCLKELLLVDSSSFSLMGIIDLELPMTSAFTDWPILMPILDDLPPWEESPNAELGAIVFGPFPALELVLVGGFMLSLVLPLLRFITLDMLGTACSGFSLGFA
jgi:hypothetical protein